MQKIIQQSCFYVIRLCNFIVNNFKLKFNHFKLNVLLRVENLLSTDAYFALRLGFAVYIFIYFYPRRIKPVALFLLEIANFSFFHCYLASLGKKVVILSTPTSSSKFPLFARCLISVVEIFYFFAFSYRGTFSTSFRRALYNSMEYT